MPDDKEDEVKDRFASRFESEDDAQTDKTDQNARTSRKSSTSNSASTSRKLRASESSRNVGNVKAEWETFTFYLDTDLGARLNRLYKKLDWQLDEEAAFSMTKTRHYYPLVVQLGLDRLDNMDVNDIKEALEEMERTDD